MRFRSGGLDAVACGALAFGLVLGCGPSRRPPGDDAGGRDGGGTDASAPATECASDSECAPGLYCRSAGDGRSRRCVAPRSEPVPCAQVPLDAFPQHGDACAAEALPDGHVCRMLECAFGCRPTCSCVDGRWQCADACIDWPPGGAAYCGRAPVCVDFRVCGAWPRDAGFLPCLVDADCPDGQRCAEDTADRGRCAP